MNLLSLPTELLLEIAKHLENQAWLNAFARTNRFIFNVINPYLHRYNADYQKHTALAFGACRGLETVVRRSLAAKPGDINAKIGSIIPTSGEAFHTPVCYALQHGQTRVLELLLDEYGADIEQPCCKSITPLNCAVGLGKLDLIKVLIDRGVNIHAGEGGGPRPLLQSALSGDLGCMQFLIQKGADVHQTTPAGGPGEAWSCLHFMVMRGNMDGVKRLVELGVDLDTVSVRGTTPVKIAVEWGHLAIASYLLECGARVPEDQDFFVSCAMRGYLKGLKLALDKVVSIDNEDSNGYTALSEATANGHVEAVRLLLDRGAGATIDTMSSAITIAAGHDLCRVLEVLLDHVDESGYNRKMCHADALQVAMRNEHWDCAKELLNKGAETNFNVDDELPLSYAARLGEEEVARLLLEKGAGADDDPTLLFWVVKNLSIEVLRQLLERGLDPNEYSEALQQGSPSILKHSHKGWLLPPLACAMRGLFYDKAELLIDYGADPRPVQRGKQRITLVNVTQSMRCTLIAKFVNRGFDVNEKSHTGETPISLRPAGAGKVEVVEFLLRRGADPNIRIGPSPSVLSLAMRKGHSEVADVLRKHGAKEMCEEMDVDAEDDSLAGVAELLSSE
ncbi:hypothetical protein CFD26_101803 [Aspergillus turcosus]|uniref:F-box domain-containing protein n=1 Tax=Aspergillus turcosus TaxID=1245748 RepID=A0A421CWU5_9EURO|nr:hypothetical protein CFD26_101803 [Aspergillus turcosus]